MYSSNQNIKNIAFMYIVWINVMCFLKNKWKKLIERISRKLFDIFVNDDAKTFKIHKRDKIRTNQMYEKHFIVFNKKSRNFHFIDVLLSIICDRICDKILTKFVHSTCYFSKFASKFASKSALKSAIIDKFSFDRHVVFKILRQILSH